MLTYTLGLLLVLLPERYRRQIGGRLEIHWIRAAQVSGSAQFLFGLGLLIDRYIEFAHEIIRRYGSTMEKAGMKSEEAFSSALFTLGPASWLEYLFQPVTLLLIYLCIEAMVRIFGAFFFEQTIGSLPLYLFEVSRARGAEVKRQVALPRLVPDEVRRQDDGLVIASCRPRESWDHLITIEYEGEFYELAGMLVGKPPRPYVYRLRPIPAGKIIRGLHHYHPAELLPSSKSAPRKE